MGRPSKWTHELWAEVEREYNTGVMTVDTISSVYGIPAINIRQRASRLGWKRSLAARVQRRAEERLIEDAIPPAQRAVGQHKKDAELIAVAAELQKIVIANQRDVVTRATGLCSSLLEELTVQTMSKEDLAEVAELMFIVEGQEDPNSFAAKDPDFVRKKITAWTKTFDVSKRVSTLKDLTTAMATLIKLERAVYGIQDLPDPDAPAGTDASTMPMNDVARRIAYVLRQGVKNIETKTINQEGDSNDD